MLETVTKSGLGVLFLFAVLFSATPIFAQQIIPASLSADRRTELQNQLSDVETQIAAQQKILDTQRKQSQSLQRDVAILDAKIAQGKLSIKARNLTIQQLTDDIGQKQVVIGKLSDKLDNEKESLSQILRKNNELDKTSIVEFVLQNQTLSEFFTDVESFRSLNGAIQASLGVVTNTRTETEEEKQTLEDKKSEQQDLLHIQQLEQAKVQQEEKDKQSILKQSKGLESQYQIILKKQQQTAAQIKAELFQLQGSVAIPFETAYKYAKEVEGRLGVRAAFLLGIIAEESNLGANVGTGNWTVDMKSPRDTEPFKTITASLGLDPDKMPVSKKAWYGWGGAMGPAQFIPSTWILYVDRIAEITGSNPPNPWNPRDAFFASGLLLKDNGATNGTRASERLAALRYLAGWANAKKSAYAFYGNEVMNLADKYQAQINILNQ
ncbi:MAG: lytic murein transglycosylase [bacterium]|nr:lytic murein transglycosylase [bacterium]